jgi:hypothetical protein
MAEVIEGAVQAQAVTPAAFNPNAVGIRFVFNFAQVDLIIKGLGKLPHEQVSEFINALRGHAVQQIQDAEFKHAAATTQEETK